MTLLYKIRKKLSGDKKNRRKKTEKRLKEDIYKNKKETVICKCCMYIVTHIVCLSMHIDTT